MSHLQKGGRRATAAIPPAVASVALVALVALVASCGAPESPRSFSPVQQGIEEAAGDYQVPASLLLGAAWVESGFRPPSGLSLDGSAGLFRLTPYPSRRSLARAAELTGLTEHELATDPAASARGAAATLREVADRTFGEYRGLRESDLSDWWWALTLWCSVNDAALAELWAKDVYLAVNEGRARELSDGWVVLPPTPAAFERHLLFATREFASGPTYPGGIWRPSPNYSSRNGTAIDRIVVHTTQGGYSGAVSWLRNPDSGVSSHYVIKSDGTEISQLVDDADKAWHVQCYNPRSIGLEHEGYVDDPGRWYTPAMYDISADLSRWLCDAYGMPKNRTTIIGHNEAPPECNTNAHSDPGSGWDWTGYMDRIAGPQGPRFNLWIEADDPPGRGRFWNEQGESAGIYDMLEGDVTAHRLFVKNEGNGAAVNVVLGIWIEEPYLALRRWDIWSDWNGWHLNDSNDHPENPPHDNPGGAFLLHLYAMSPGETKRIDLTVEATGYSIGKVDQPDIRYWVKHVDDFYEKDDFSSGFNNVNGIQTYAGGDLRAYWEYDVHARARWDFDSDHTEGWTAGNGIDTLGIDRDASALAAHVAGEDPFVYSPDQTRIDAGALQGIELSARSGLGARAGQLFFVTEADPGWDEAKSLRFAFPGSGSFEPVTLDLSGHPLWTGTVTRLRLDPWQANDGDMFFVEHLRAVAQVPGTTGDADGDGVLAVPAGDDCDDAHAEAYPGAVEICDGLDNDCSGAADEGLRNACGGCGDGSEELCGNGLDDDCDGTADEGCPTGGGGSGGSGGGGSGGGAGGEAGTLLPGDGGEAASSAEVEGGCGCTSGAAGETGLLVLLALALARPRRR